MEQAHQAASAPTSIPTTDIGRAIRIWRAGVAAVEGEHATRAALEVEEHVDFDSVLAVGKAASAMLVGALELLPADARVLLVTKKGHVESRLVRDPRIRIIEAGHPMPDGNSLVAGDVAWDLVGGCAAHSRLLVLVSGGASALLEKPAPGMDLADLRRLSDTLLADGYSIDQINHIRIAVSQVKGGRLMRRFRGREILVLGISDIPGDDAGLIGSGIAALGPPVVKPFPIPQWIEELMAGMPAPEGEVQGRETPFHYRSRLVGSNTVARRAAEDAAAGLGYPVIESAEILAGDVAPLAERLAARLRDGENGVYIWGGEPTVRLPENPGRGGRNQSLALALAVALGEQDDIGGVVAGTDGTDGPTRDAGGIVASLVDRGAAVSALVRADAGSCLSALNRLFTTGPTGTNVMDLAILVKRGLDQ